MSRDAQTIFRVLDFSEICEISTLFISSVSFRKVLVYFNFTIVRAIDKL